MKKTQQIQKELNRINSEIAKVSFELKDTSFRRSGGYFGTDKADTNGVVIVRTIARTKYLNTYVCVSLNHSQLVNELRGCEAALRSEELRLAKRAYNKWANDSINYCTRFVDEQIADGTVNTNYVKVFVVGNNNIYGAHPFYQHSDYNKFRAMPNTAKHRAIANSLNAKLIAAGVNIAETVL